MTRLSVWWDGRIAGTLTRDQHGDMGFVYDTDWLADTTARPISAALPKRAEPYDRRAARYFFAGLLPEEGPREAVARALGLSRTNDYALLEALGGDVAGALTLWPEGEVPPVFGVDAQPEVLSDSALVEILDSLPARPLLAGRAGIRLSLAGAQNKLPVVLVDGRIALPAPGQPTTHILKPAMTRFPATVENEALCMRLAGALGLSVAPVETRAVEGRKFLLVERYDRAVGADGNLARVHQEDFCQALGHAPEHKYAAEGGPTFKTSFALLRGVSTRPATDVLALLDAAIFNVIICNCDAHGKNFSLLYPAGETRLAPLYDLMSTVAYPEVSNRMAMKLGGASSFDDVTGDTWATFAKDVRLGAPFVRRRVQELAKLTGESLGEVIDELSAPELENDAIDFIAIDISTRAHALQGKLI
jgi:serine/threonine-protein kinase HipA